jgi:uncharacterized tellurite resistance protein B-like protein
MTFEEKRMFLQCLFAIAWVDGAIGETENAILATLFNHVELPHEDREAIVTWFDAPPPEPDWEAAAATPELRTALLEQVYLVAASDGSVEASELRLMEGLRQRLKVGDAEFNAVAQKIEKLVSGN